MVISIDVKHVYKHPLELVANTHFTKYPSKLEKFVKRIDVIQKSYNSGIEYRKSVAVCDNVVPRILRMFEVLDEKAILLEEQAWLDVRQRRLELQSRNLTWAKYATMTEQSTFKTHQDNKNWTVFEQHGCIDIQGLGKFGKVIEMFAERFLHAGVKRSLRIMENLLEERSMAATQNTAATEPLTQS